MLFAVTAPVPLWVLEGEVTSLPGKIILKGRAIMRVLVVDDDPFLADTIQEVLKNDGFEVMSACDGMDGYTTYLLFKPDVVITDIQMPRNNGLEMMKRIRLHNPMIKTIYISGNIASFKPYLLEEKKRYPVSFFEKPFSFESLIRIITEPALNWLPESAVTPA